MFLYTMVHTVLHRRVQHCPCPESLQPRSSNATRDRSKVKEAQSEEVQRTARWRFHFTEAGFYTRQQQTRQRRAATARGTQQGSPSSQSRTGRRGPGHRRPPSVPLPSPRARAGQGPSGSPLPRQNRHVWRARRGPGPVSAAGREASVLPGSAEAAPGAALPAAVTGRSSSARRAGTGEQPRAPGPSECGAEAATATTL